MEEFYVWIALCGGLILGLRHIRTFMKCNGSFTLPDSDSDSDSDSKPDGYIALCRNIHIGSDPDPDPCKESFPNRYCTHFRDRYPSLFHTLQSGDQSLDPNQCEISA